ncbi:hypothetical protein PRZ48_009407 [Zasmidium cellare]|uniref:EKC/KEOPS complex subunit GON7 n=1 Tax=Zasmidium cellare TaxID=395010 RepID=A0ABR0EBN4_ZASCE|nr:hypothetical protein PRZ48_009407 [Zasmidium cellare]
MPTNQRDHFHDLLPDNTDTSTSTSNTTRQSAESMAKQAVSLPPNQIVDEANREVKSKLAEEMKRAVERAEGEGEGKVKDPGEEVKEDEDGAGEKDKQGQ